MAFKWQWKVILPPRVLSHHLKKTFKQQKLQTDNFKWALNSKALSHSPFSHNSAVEWCKPKTNENHRANGCLGQYHSFLSSFSWKDIVQQAQQVSWMH
jgi:hypothetical protein